MTKSEKKRNEQRGRKKKKPQRDELTNGAPTLEPAMGQSRIGNHAPPRIGNLADLISDWEPGIPNLRTV